MAEVYIPLQLTEAEFWAIPEYSFSFPTGTTIGKRWRKFDAFYDDKNYRNWVRSLSEDERNDPLHVKLRQKYLSDLSKHVLIGEYYDIGSLIEIGIRWYRPSVIMDYVG